MYTSVLRLSIDISFQEIGSSTSIDEQGACKFQSQTMFPVYVGGRKQCHEPAETNCSRSGPSPDPIGAFFETPILKQPIILRGEEYGGFKARNKSSEKIRPSATEVKLKTKNWPRSYDDAQFISKFKGKLDGTQDGEQSQIC